jgi:hypothetical protein
MQFIEILNSDFFGNTIIHDRDVFLEFRKNFPDFPFTFWVRMLSIDSFSSRFTGGFSNYHTCFDYRFSEELL